MTDIVERLRDRCDRKFINALCEDAADEIERLKADAAKWQELASQGIQIERELRVEIERLRAALTPFAFNVDAVSLRNALGHISREDLLRARAALEPKP